LSDTQTSQKQDKPTQNEDDLNLTPLAQYQNRLNKMFYNLSVLMSQHNIPTRYLYKPLRVIIYVFPPEAKKVFEPILKQLWNSPNEEQTEKIFSLIHNWAWDNLLELKTGIKAFSQARQKDFDKIDLEG